VILEYPGIILEFNVFWKILEKNPLKFHGWFEIYYSFILKKIVKKERNNEKKSCVWI